MNAKVSVIVPVYNVEQYLNECLDSICNQTLQDMEIICINDGSTDSSPRILESWAAKDARVRVLHQENKGYGYAVNRGMRTAVGEYVGIVEPDDYIGLKMMEALYTVAVKEDVDFVKADFEIFWEDDEKRCFKQEKIVLEDSLYGRQLKPAMEINVFWGWIANWAGIYKRSYLLKNQIRHNESPGASYQDQGFWFQVYALAEKVFFVPEVYYKYRQDNPNSSMLSRKKVFCIMDEYRFIYQIMRNKRQEFIPLLPVYIKRKFALYLFNYMRIEDIYKIDFLRRFSKDFCEHEAKGELDLKYFNYKEKKELRMIMDFPESYPRMYEVEVEQFNDLLKEKKIWIYGAGKIAEETWNLLTEENRHRVEGVMVSDLVGNKKEFHGIQLVKFETEQFLNENEQIIVVAVSLKNAEEIVKRLRERNIWDYVLVKEQITAR